MRLNLRASRITVAALAVSGSSMLAGCDGGSSIWEILSWLLSHGGDGDGWCEDDGTCDDDGEDEEEEPLVCPCFDAATIDADLAGLSTEALSWEVRSTGTTDEYSLRGYVWEYDTDAGVWNSPTMGYDVFRQPDEGDAPYCEEWSETWQAAPYHDWAGDYDGYELELTEAEYDLCLGILETWVSDNGVPLTSW